jgi:glycosyltransferase involved in cell wall biosynthesis
VTPATAPEISVIIPVYSHPVEFVHMAIESVLVQTLPAAEIIVVLDGAPTEVETELRAAYQPPVRFVSQPNSGIAGARNAGIEASSGALLAFLDSDDLWVATKLELQWSMLADDSTLDAVYGHAEQFYDESVDDEFTRRHPIPKGSTPAWLSTSMLIWRTSFMRIGHFDGRNSGGLDMHWYVTAQEHGIHCVMLSDVVYHRRVHRTNFGIVNQTEANRSRLLAAKRHLDLRRRRDLDSRHSEGPTPS